MGKINNNEELDKLIKELNEEKLRWSNKSVISMDSQKEHKEKIANLEKRIKELGSSNNSIVNISLY